MMATDMVGKRFKIAIGTRESLNKCGKILQQVDCFIDGQTGTLYIVPQKDEFEIEDNMCLKYAREPFEIFI